MTTDQLQKGIELQDKIAQAKALLNRLQGAKMVSVQFHYFNENRVIYHEENVFELPKNEIKKALISHHQQKLQDLEKKFADLGTVEKQNLNNGPQPALQETDIFPISKVVFFDRKNGKYVAHNGVEITTELLVKNRHKIFQDEGYVIIEDVRQKVEDNYTCLDNKVPRELITMTELPIKQLLESWRNDPKREQS